LIGSSLMIPLEVCTNAGPLAPKSLDALFGQYLEEPGTIMGDGEPRSPIADHLPPDGILDGMQSVTEVGPELFWSLFIDQLMHVGVAADAYDPRVFARHPPEAEEGRRLLLALEQVQDTVHVLFDTRRVMTPLPFGTGGFVVQDMEPLLDVEGQDLHCNTSNVFKARPL